MPDCERAWLEQVERRLVEARLDKDKLRLAEEVRYWRWCIDHPGRSPAEASPPLYWEK